MKLKMSGEACSMREVWPITKNIFEATWSRQLDNELIGQSYCFEGML